MTVPEPKFKFEALEGLISVLDPKRVVILADSDEAAHQVVSGLELSYDSRLVVLQAEQIAQLDEITACSDVRHPGGSQTVVLIRGSNIPKFPSGKMLLVLFDTPQNPIQYAPGQDTSEVISVSLVLPEEKDGLPHSAKEANPFMYVFFKGELAIMDHDRCCYFCFTQSP